MITVLSFLFAIGVLIAIHEYGHYRTALACGIKVLKFSIGFGPSLLKWTSKKTGIEYAIGLLPLGGFVRMLDEREAPVESKERHLAFNTQPLYKRALVVAAGPLANLALAVILYAFINWTGINAPYPILAAPDAQTLAAKAGLQGGEWVLKAGLDDEPMKEIQSFDQVRWLLMQGALNGQVANLLVQTIDGEKGGFSRKVVQLPLKEVDASEANEKLLKQIGFDRPLMPPVIAEIGSGGRAQQAGLQKGDWVVSIDGKPITSAQQLQKVISENTQAVAQTWQVLRAPITDGELNDLNRSQETTKVPNFSQNNWRPMQLVLTPKVEQVNGKAIGRAGIGLGVWATVKYGFFEGLWQGVVRTWEISKLSLELLFKVVTGQASLKNLSGPLTIAEFAGKTASVGIMPFVLFLAMVSVSLGVLNLLPVPVLDGGHLMYFLWEGLTGKEVSEKWLERLQRVGVTMLLLLMCVAIFNDITRIFL